MKGTLDTAQIERDYFTLDTAQMERDYLEADTSNSPPQTGQGGKAPRKKGFGFEREVVNAAKDAGLYARRAYGSDGRALGLHSEVDLIVGELHLQAKRTKQVAAKYRPSQHVDGVVFREDRGYTFVMLKLDILFDLLLRND